MDRLTSILLIVFLYIASAKAAIPNLGSPSGDRHNFEVIIVGGGPAGLSSLSAFARMRREVLLIDSGEYRNDQTRHMHDVIGNDHTAPSLFQHLARQQISRYPTAHMKNGTIVSITNHNNGTSFTVLEASGETHTTKKLILATGVRDILPDTPGLKETWSRGIYWCPWCDGYEHRDQPFGILGSLLDVAASLYKMYSLNSNLVAFVNGTQTAANSAVLNKKSPGWEELLLANNVEIENRTIESIVRLQDGAVVKDDEAQLEYDLFRVFLRNQNGSAIPFRRDIGAFITNFPSVQRSDLGSDLGVSIFGGKMDVGRDTRARGSEGVIHGVFAVGDANSDNSTNVPHAMYTGKLAAVCAHVDLAKERARSLVGKRSLDLVQVEEDARSEWAQLVGRNLDPIWHEVMKARTAKKRKK